MYVCLRNTFKGILEKYNGEKSFFLGESSAKSSILDTENFDKN